MMSSYVEGGAETNKKPMESSLLESSPETDLSGQKLEPTDPHMRNTTRPTWVEDAKAPTCTRCDAEFTFMLRRHHCRGCGQVFCHACSNYFLQLPESFLYDNPQRTCIDCYKQYSNLDYKKIFDSYGNPSGPTIVMLHSSCTNRKIHSFLIPQLTKKGYRVIVMDLPGHGSREDELLTMDTAVHAVRDVVESYIISKQAVIFGFQLGGFVAMMFAQRYPHMCHGLILSGCCFDDDAFAKTSRALVTATFSLVPNQYLWRVIPTMYSSIQLSDWHDTLLRSGATYKVLNDCNTLISSNFENYETALKNFAGPVMFINGEKDGRKNELSYVESSPNSRLHVVKGGNRYMILEEKFRDEVSDVMVQYCDDIFHQEMNDRASQVDVDKWI